MKRFGRRIHLVPPASPADDWAAHNDNSPSTEDQARQEGRSSRVALRLAMPGEAGETVLDPTVRERLRILVLEYLRPEVAVMLTHEQLRKQLETVIHELADRERVELSSRAQAQLTDDLVNEMIGYGPLEPLLQDDSIADIMVNGPERVFVEVAGKIHPTGVRFRSHEQLVATAQKIAAGAGRRVDEASPLVDCRLPDGSRLNIVFPPLAVDGVYVSIRKFSRRGFDMQALVENGTMTLPVARIIEIATRCRLNMLISGGTGSGKTTLMNALSRDIHHDERIVTIEDAAELQLQQPHIVRLETRPANLEGAGEVTQRQLVRNALRMRPDRIIVGEVRGPEAFDMLQAMNTGHDGSICTVHANSARDALTRIENMVQMGATNLPHSAIRSQLVSALDLVIQIERQRDGQRRIAAVSEICGLEGDVVTMNEVFSFEYAGEDMSGRILGRYTSARVRPAFQERLDYFGLLGAWMEALQRV